MKIPALFQSLFGRFGAATELPSDPPPKAPKGGGSGFPGYRVSTVGGSAKVQQKAFDITNVSIPATYRGGATTLQVVRDLSRASPELAGSIAANNRIGIPEKFIAIARDPDGAFNVDATRLVMQILRRMNTMPDYINGFSQVGSLRSVSEALAKEIQQTGAMAVELVLDKSRLPFALQPIPVGSIIFYEDGKGLKPVQKVGGDEIDLDVPTFFYTSLDQSLYDAYAQSPLESAIQPVLASTQFVEDLRRLCARHVYKRYDISIDEEKFRSKIPPDIIHDTDKLNDFYNSTLQAISDMIQDVGVEEAFVHFDFFEIKYIEGDSGDTPATFETIRNIHDGKIATASKTPPSILGMGSKTQTVASTETLTFMKNVDGMIRQKLQELYSKAFTLAVRLMGHDVTVEFEFDEIELRPRSELEAFFQMRQERITNQLAWGFITDEEAILRLTGQLPPAGYKPLMGTMFKTPTPAAEPEGKSGNPVSNTSALGGKTKEGAKGGKK